jgi:hypothetical protein
MISRRAANLLAARRIGSINAFHESSASQGCRTLAASLGQIVAPAGRSCRSFNIIFSLS